VTEFQVPASARRCQATGRELKAGDGYHGVLLDAGGTLVRHDYAPDAWTGPPPGAIGHWAGRVPAGDPPRRAPVDDAMLLACLRRLDGAAEPARVNLRYVVALLLLRRKVLRLDDGRSDEFGEVLTFTDRAGDRHEVRDPRMGATELAAAQAEVFEVLGWDGMRADA
jgi:hypothetical protein